MINKVAIMKISLGELVSRYYNKIGNSSLNLINTLSNIF